MYYAVINTPLSFSTDYDRLCVVQRVHVPYRIYLFLSYFIYPGYVHGLAKLCKIYERHLGAGHKIRFYILLHNTYLITKYHSPMIICLH